MTRKKQQSDWDKIKITTQKEEFSKTNKKKKYKLTDVSSLPGSKVL